MISSSLLIAAAFATLQTPVQTADFPVATWVTLREIRDEAVLLKSQVPALTTLGSKWTPALTAKPTVYRFPGPQRTIIVEDSFLFQNESLLLGSLLRENSLPILSQTIVVPTESLSRRALITFALSKVKSHKAAKTLYLLLNTNPSVDSFRVSISPAFLEKSTSGSSTWVAGFDRNLLSGTASPDQNPSAKGLSIYSTLPILSALVDLRLLEEQLVAISGGYRKPSSKHITEASRLRSVLANAGTTGFAKLLAESTEGVQLIRVSSSFDPVSSARNVPLGFAIRVQHPLDPSGDESIAILPWTEL